MNATELIRALLVRLGLWRLPVRVRAGIASGARWTLLPYSAYWRGTHEPALQQELLRLGDGDIRGWHCWDIGAHFGLYSIGLARRVGHTGSVASFEPDPVSVRRLERHRRMNGCTNLHIFAAAASSRSGQAEIYTYGNPGATTTHLPYEEEPRHTHVRPIEIQTWALDDLVANGQLTPPRFVKIDAEGHGHHVLEGMKRTVSAARPIIFMGFHSAAEIAGTRAVLGSSYTWRRIGGTDAEGSDALQIGADYRFNPVPESVSGPARAGRAG